MRHSGSMVCPSLSNLTVPLASLDEVASVFIYACGLHDGLPRLSSLNFPRWQHCQLPCPARLIWRRAHAWTALCFLERRIGIEAPDPCSPKNSQFKMIIPSIVTDAVFISSLISNQNPVHFNTVCAPRNDKYCSTVDCGNVLMYLYTSAL
jgi:hypothetical protein